MFPNLVRTITNQRFQLGKKLETGRRSFSIPLSWYSTDERNDSKHSTNDIKSIPKPTSSFRLRKQKLAPFPQIDCVRELEIESFIRSNFKQVKYGEHNFKECLEGFVQVYVAGHEMGDFEKCCGYSVCFGRDHPMNLSGPVLDRQKLNHANLYGFLRAMEIIPQDSFKKVCFNVGELTMTTFVSRTLMNLSENSFRSVRTGKLNKDLQTCMALNKVLRSRKDLTIRVKFCPLDIRVTEMFLADKYALRAAKDAQSANSRQDELLK